MYGKIFTSIYDSTLVEDWRALITFQQFIVLSDSDGVVDKTPPAIARRTNIPIDIIEAGIKFLEQPDPYSRTPNENGARIVRLDDHRNWGWKIVNHEKYLKLTDYEKVKEQNRERQKRYRDKNKNNNVSNVSVTDDNAKSRHIDKDEDKDINKTKTSMSSPNGDNVPFQQIIDLYHEILPELPKCEILNAKRKGYIRQRWQDKKHGLHTINHWKNFFEFVSKSDFLMGKTPPSGNRPPFRANLEWITNLNNYTKIYEDKYHG